MFPTFTTFAALLALSASVQGLTITSPSSGAALDPSQPITVTWTSTSSDPPVFNLVLDNTNSGSLTPHNTVLSSGISTSTGTYTIPAYALLTYGSDFVFKATDSSGSNLATSPSFTLALGSNQVSTLSGGGQVLISTSTGAPAGTGLSSGTGAITATVTSATGATASGTASASTVGNGNSTISTTSHSSSSSSFRTSTTSSTSSRSGSASSTSSSATASSSANAQPRLSGNTEIVLSAAGVMAGIVALLA